jgi:allantoinase
MTFDLVVRGDLVLPDRIVEDGYLAVSKGRIAAIGVDEAPPADSTENYPHHLLFPGLVDAQVHSGSYEGTAGLRDATAAAAAGGVTTIVDMPFDNPDPVNNVAALEAKIALIAELAHVDVALYGTAAKVGGPTDIRQLAEAGVCGIKLSTYEYHPSRFPRFSSGEILDVLEQAAPIDLPVAFHNEDQEIVNHLTARVRANGQIGPETHALTRPVIAELSANAQLLELGLQTGARVHIVHSSVARGYAMARHYRALGARASVETCLQYLIFNEDDVVRHGPSLKQTPPLRSETERKAMWDALVAGEIQIVSTDHVAWPLSRKSDPDMFKNSSGIPGLETLLPIFYTALTDRGLPPTVIANVCARNVANHFGFGDQKGSLRVGADADIVAFKREAGVFDQATMTSAEKWSPYHGFATSGRVAATFLRGRKIYAEGKLTGGAGDGSFVRPVQHQSEKGQ